VLRQLVQDVQQLTKRVGQIERKSRKVIYSGPLNYRLKRLEEKVQSMTDGGNP
jgi:hypothetical protein